MDYKKSELRTALLAVNPAVGKENLVEQSGDYFFFGDRIVTYNDHICISYPFDTDFKCSVNASDLYKVICNIDEPELEIIHKEDTLHVKTKTTKAKLSTVREGNHLSEVIQSLAFHDNTVEWTSVEKDLINGINLCSFSTSRDVTYENHHCVCFAGDELYSSDGFRISRYLLDDDMPRMLIPVSSLRECMKFNIQGFFKDDAWIHFQCDLGVVVSSRLVRGGYDLKTARSILDTAIDHKDSSFNIPENIQKIVKSVGLIAEGMTDIEKEIIIILNKGSFECRASKEGASLMKQVAADYKGNAVEFTISPNFLYQILDKATNMSIVENLALFQTDNFFHVMALPTKE